MRGQMALIGALLRVAAAPWSTARREALRRASAGDHGCAGSETLPGVRTHPGALLGWAWDRLHPGSLRNLQWSVVRHERVGSFEGEKSPRRRASYLHQALANGSAERRKAQAPRESL